MNLSEYFQQKEGIGILGTCNEAGRVNMAVYARPVVIDDDTIALVMQARLSHQNVVGNLNAAYMFIEQGPGYHGIRMSLTMLHEEQNQSLIESLRKRQPAMFLPNDHSNKFLVFFRVDDIRSLTSDTSYTAETFQTEGTRHITV